MIVTLICRNLLISGILLADEISFLCMFPLGSNQVPFVKFKISTVCITRCHWNDKPDDKIVLYPYYKRICAFYFEGYVISELRRILSCVILKFIWNSYGRGALWIGRSHISYRIYQREREHNVLLFSLHLFDVPMVWRGMFSIFQGIYPKIWW